MDDNDDYNVDITSRKRKTRSMTAAEESERNKRKKATHSPVYYSESEATESESELDESSDSHTSDDNVNTAGTDGSNDDTDTDDSDYDEYFERDTAKMRRTVVEHVLGKFTNAQANQYRARVEDGVDRAFDLFQDLVDEHLTESIPNPNLWKLGLGPEEIRKYSAQLKELRSADSEEPVTIKRILDAHLDTKAKGKLLKYFDALQDLKPHSTEYIALQNQINSILRASQEIQVTTAELYQMNQTEQELKRILHTEIPLKTRILTADMDPARKAAVYEKYLLLQKTPDDSVTAASLEEWIEEALKTPFTKMAPSILDQGTPGECLLKLKEGFQRQLSDLDIVLEPLLSIFNNQMSTRNTSSSLVIGLLGGPGVGKTSCGKVIAEVWGMPFQQISLGGIVDSSILDGQHPGWVGSGPGRFAKALQEMGVINGVLFLDEIDKLGETQHGLEVQYSLLHSTDPIQNSKFHDHYLGSKLPLDLSKCLIICALNKTEGLDPALLNRMHIIKVPDYTPQQKTNIMLRHLFPQALEQAGLTTDDLALDANTCAHIQRIVEQRIGKEGGVRGVKACIRMVVDKLALLLNTSVDEQQQLRLTFKLLLSKETPRDQPIDITPAIIDKLYKLTEDTASWRLLYN